MTPMSSGERKHICIVTDAWYPQVNGVVRTLDSIRKEMEKRGHTVSLITPDQFHTFPMPTYPEIRLAYAAKEKNGNVSHHLERIKPDQIYIATEGPLGLAARHYCTRKHLNFTTGYHTKYPEFASAHGVPAGQTLGYLYMHHFHDPANYVLAPSESQKDELQARKFKNARAWTRGVDTELFHIGPSSALDEFKDKGPIFLNVGRVSYEKGLPDFLNLDLPGTKVVVGDGPAMEPLKKAHPEAVFLGRKMGEELAAIYRAADVFVFPSKHDTFGNVQIEALASGVPVAAYNATGSRDVVTNPRIGALAENDDLREACLKALELKRNGCEDICRQHVLDHFTWEKAADIFESYLVDVGAPNHFRSHAKEAWKNTGTGR